MAAGAGQEHKDQGNDLFRSGEYLKAAASYTKAIKAEPDNYIYYSNRANAFLKLNKITKALEDADKCLELNPEFIKGYHRKASALQAQERTQEALEVLFEALVKEEGNPDLKKLGVQIKGKSFNSWLKQERIARGIDAPPPPKPVPAAKKPEPVQQAQPTPAPAKEEDSAPKHLWELNAADFAVEMIKDALGNFLKEGKLPASVYMQPPKPSGSSDEEPALGCVSVEQAFTNPENLVNCVDFLRQHIGQTSAQAAAVVVMKKQIAYPQVWKEKPKEKWPFPKKGDGIFLQMESPVVRNMWFTALDKDPNGQLKVGETVELNIEDFALVPPLYR